MCPKIFWLMKENFEKHIYVKKKKRSSLKFVELQLHKPNFI